MSMGSLCCDMTGSRGLESTADSDAKLALKRHKEIEKYLASEKERSSKVRKIFVLGLRESGKSTVMKQMHSIYSNGFSEEERRKARPVILERLLHIFQILLSNMDTERIVFGTETVKLSADLISKTDADSDALFSGSPVDAAICAAMKNVWLDPAMRTVVSENHHVFPRDDWLYFYNSTDRLTTPEWLPNYQDTLRAPIHSHGVSEVSFNKGPTIWEMISMDLRGIGERRKIIHHFEDVHYVLYVVPLSDYDLHLIQDPEANMMHEMILGFEQCVYSRWFKDKPVIIFLNKVDEFKEKLAISPLSGFCPDFDGSNTDFSAAAGYFANRFRASATARARDRQVYTYFTNATDTASMKAAMENLSSSIV